MLKYAWATDTHFDHLDQKNNLQLIKFANELVATNPTGIFLTGDISSSPNLVHHLSVLETVVQRPIYYVLGNHDYYFSSIKVMRDKMFELSRISDYLKYVPSTSYVALSTTTALVGHDGWYDAMYGVGAKSRFVMNDWRFIGDFVQYSGGSSYIAENGQPRHKDLIVERARHLANNSIQHIAMGIKEAIKAKFTNIIVMTHFPPYPEAHRYKDAPSNPEIQPWYTSKMLGDTLLAAATAHSNIQFTSLSGHTHSAYEGFRLPNLKVCVGNSEYRFPVISNIIEVS